MPAFSFKGQFVPYVEDGSKPHTIRNRRKHPAKVGDKLFLYFGLRTKWSRKLREEVCSATHSLVICDTLGVIFYKRALTDDELQEAVKNPVNSLLPVDRILISTDADLFAWKDGFRPKDATQKHPIGSFRMMLLFWKQTHILPWGGDIIYWSPKN